ncbi:malto-oligosyltrehalose synthase [Cellulosimicrobium cellulans]|uniref:malto-oligosyltrehalose synthase n=1 Tax=Cellulosimicrobium cellulans TaxID=1710 RepID=UPI002406FF79|nr:malto-oligosyltrehalose synthase [Cellulosimicrobium cellulans]MDF9876097.1 (1->4)-alpha-D-glucan 1-alpha-D-glucosylmutase [Cellulosimicrobium cellulans]
MTADHPAGAPGARHRVPVSTYRLQLGPDLTFDDAARQVPYLASLGVTHLYLSPVLQAAPGSTHGYDVVDHARVSDELGGRDGLDRLAASARAAGLGIVLDVVPNHMAVPTPAWHNRALWSVLEDGADSPYARWFDVDWSAGEGAVLMPVLGARLGDVLAAGEITVDEVEIPGSPAPRRVLRYYDHVFPVRPGTEDLPLTELVERQHYRLAYWRVGDEELNYRRFFDVGSLVAVRVEDEEVFDATHALVLGLVTDGTADGLRIDHPDGLADPAQYLQRLADRTDGAWVVVEKILAGEEQVPPDWATVGTTGYDVAWRLQQLFVDAGGRSGLDAVMTRLTGAAPGGLGALVEGAKREVVAGPLYAEVHRLTDLAAAVCHDDPRLRDHTWRGLHQCLRELLVAFDRYRAYVVPGTPPRHEAVRAVEEAAERARARLDPQRAETLDVVVDLVLGREVGSAGRRREARRDELVVRFQQVCGAVTAKGVEDTAFYRWTELVSLCEVGGEPDRFSLGVHDWHAFAQRFAALTPHALTAGSTHDTKRGEDTRAALGVLSEDAGGWSHLVAEVRAATAPYRGALVDGLAENLLWQTVAGTWLPDAAPGTDPSGGATTDALDGAAIAPDRLVDYLRKALREAKVATSWTSPDDAYEEAVADLARRALADPAVTGAFARWSREHRPELRAASLGITLVRLTAPGVADVYQGAESYAPTLVDPDNRRPVDVDALTERLARLDGGSPARTLADEKLLVTTRALRLRRTLADAFVGDGAGYVPVASSTSCALAFARTTPGGEHGDDVDAAPVARVVTVATRLAGTVDRLGGWRDHVVALPEGAGAWVDVLTGREHPSGTVRVADLLAELPVALLVDRVGAASAGVGSTDASGEPAGSVP